MKCPNIGDRKKLGRLVRYLRATIHLPLIIGLNDSGNMTWIIDASFAVHMDMKSHTGYCLTLGAGSPISGSYLHKKLNMRSLTESEPVGVNDIIGFVEWASLYCKDQVKEYLAEHPFKDLGKKNLVNQDNARNIKMVKDGRRVCGPRTLNIYIEYVYHI